MVFKISQTFIRRRWLDFRNGHSIYLAFVLTFVNFILITFNFAIKELPFIGSFMTLPIFVLIFVFVYFPVCMLIGYWHRRHQYAVENETLIRENWVWAWIMQYELRLIKGKTTSKEDEYVLNYLNDILRRTNKHDLIRIQEEEEEGAILPLPRDEEIRAKNSE